MREAIEMHRETHHPTQIGIPDAFITAYIELDMSADKKVWLNFLILSDLVLLQYERVVLVNILT